MSGPCPSNSSKPYGRPRPFLLPQRRPPGGLERSRWRRRPGCRNCRRSPRARNSPSSRPRRRSCRAPSGTTTSFATRFSAPTARLPAQRVRLLRQHWRRLYLLFQEMHDDPFDVLPKLDQLLRGRPISADLGAQRHQCMPGVVQSSIRQRLVQANKKAPALWAPELQERCVGGLAFRACRYAAGSS